jgi:UDP-glucose 4-epimerase
MKILVTGGAGYIGSVVSAYLLDRNFEVTIIDDLSTGNFGLVDSRANFIKGNVLKKSDLLQAMNGCDVVVHLAAKSIVSESVDEPEIYMRNNVEGTENVLKTMQELGINKLIFSSTCAVYGVPELKTIDELCETNPNNPYGISKLEADKLISKYTKINSFECYSFRFFNVSGSYRNLIGKFFGEMHVPESHLIPNVLNSKIVTVYGSNWLTPDGTCIRDYVHVVDVARAIENAILIEKPNGHYIYNLGVGTGSSVLEVINTAENVMGRKVEVSFANARNGDQSELVSNPALSEIELKWKALLTLKDMIKDSYEFTNQLRLRN